MKLSEYVTAVRGRTGAIAKQLGVDRSLVTQWSTVRTPPLERCTPLEQATAGEVRRWDLRPLDWHIHWPELIGAQGAPPVPHVEPRRA